MNSDPKIKKSGSIADATMTYGGQIGRALSVEDWTFIPIEGSPERPGIAFSIRDDSCLLLWNRHDLVNFAKQVLQTYQPTVQDEILASLKRIEANLPKPS